MVVCHFLVSQFLKILKIIGTKKYYDKYLLGDDVSKKKIQWVFWQRMVTPKSLEGIGIG